VAPCNKVYTRITKEEIKIHVSLEQTAKVVLFTRF